MATRGLELFDSCYYDSFEELDKKQEPLINGLIRDVGQTILITGPSKAGKSFLAIQLALALANGDNWLGFKVKSPIKKIGRKPYVFRDVVLYVDLELLGSDFGYRLKAIGRAIYHIDLSSESGEQYVENFARSKIDCETFGDEQKAYKDNIPHPMAQTVIDCIKEDIEEIHSHSSSDSSSSIEREVKTVIIDPVYKAFAGDENSVKEVTQFLTKLHELGVTTILVHHHSKGSQAGKASMDRGSGSGAFARDANTIIDMIELQPKTPPEDGARAFKLEFTTRNYKTPPPKFVWFRYPIFEEAAPGELENARTTQLSNHEKGAVAMEQKKAARVNEFESLFAELDTGEGVPVSTIAEKLKLTERTVSRYVSTINRERGQKVYRTRKGVIVKE